MTTTKKPRGRPKTDKPASTRFEIRCTPEQKNKWELAAKKQNLTLAAWLKELADKNA